jgi:hypothetical protein
VSVGRQQAARTSAEPTRSASRLVEALPDRRDCQATPVGDLPNGDTRGRVYVRPYEVDIARAPATGAFAARVLRVTPLSGGLKIELSVPSLGSRMRADIDWERGTALGLSDGDNVFLSLRRARVFAPD